MQAEQRTDILSAANIELAQATPLSDPDKHLIDTAAEVDQFGVE